MTGTRFGLYAALIAMGAAWGITQPLAKMAVTAGHRDIGIIFWQFAIAAVVLEPGADTSEDALSAVVGEKLARFKHPRRYEILYALPRNAMGKVQKAALRSEHAALFTP